MSQHFGISYVAEYNLALQFLVPLQMIMTGSATIWGPHIYSVKNNKHAHDESLKILLQLFLVFIVIVPISVLFIFFAKSVNLIPPTYLDTLWLMPAMSFGVIGLVLMNIPFYLFIRIGKSSWVAYFSILGAVLVFFRNALIIPIFGYFGGAIVFGLVYFFLLISAWRSAITLLVKK